MSPSVDVVKPQATEQKPEIVKPQPVEGQSAPFDNADLSYFNKVWRGSKDGSIKLDTIPKFEDPYAEREWIKEHLAAVFRFWGKSGFGDGLAGHITVRDPVQPGYYWMNPVCVHFASMTKSKLVLVGPDGRAAPDGAQLPINNAGFFIHSAIHKARPDINAAAHCHSIYGKAWSVFGKPVEITTQDSCALYKNHAVYENFGGVVLAKEEGENIAKALGPWNKTCILQNHGLLTLGHTVDEAAHLFTTLEKQCHVMLLTQRAAEAQGLKANTIGEDDAQFSARFIQNIHTQYQAFQPEYDLLVEETNGAFLK